MGLGKGEVGGRDWGEEKERKLWSGCNLWEKMRGE